MTIKNASRELRTLSQPTPQLQRTAPQARPEGTALKVATAVTANPQVRARLQSDDFRPASTSTRPLSLTGGAQGQVTPFAGPSIRASQLSSLDGTRIQDRLSGNGSGVSALLGQDAKSLLRAGDIAGLEGANAEVARLTGSEQESAEEAIVEAVDTRDAQAVADWLREHPDAEDRAEFYDFLFSLPHLAGEVLNNVDNLSTADRQLLANSLNAAYESGAVTSEELAEGVVAGGYGASFGETHEGLADIVARTGNPDLIGTYASRELELARANGEQDLQRVQAAAAALNGLSPTELQDYLAQNGEDVNFLVDNINYDGGFGYAETSTALGDLLETAARIQPPTEQSLALFERSIPRLGENPHSREGAAQFFERNIDQVLASYTDASGSLTLEGQEKLGHFFGNTLFSEPSFPGQEQLQEALLGKLDELASSLDAEANANPPSIEAQERARLLGSLIGTVEGGFQFAVDELEQKNQAIEGFTDFLFKAGELIPDLPFPGGGLIKDVALDQLQEWVTDSLTEEAEKPEDALPFHAAFAEGIDNPSLRTAYDAARADVFQNVVKELIN
jgi:hypothetical protein